MVVDLAFEKLKSFLAIALAEYARDAVKLEVFPVAVNAIICIVPVGSFSSEVGWHCTRMVHHIFGIVAWVSMETLRVPIARDMLVPGLIISYVCK